MSRRSPRPLAVLAAAFALLLTLATCAPSTTHADAGHGILVIAIDGLRADHVSSFGYDRPTTPWLDELAEKGTAFTNAFSTSPELLPTHAALLTGCDPTLAQRPALPRGGEQPPLARWYIPELVPRLAQELLIGGYETAAFVDHPTISPVFGFGGGFQSFHGFDPEDAPPRQEMGFEKVSSKMLDWLAETPISKSWFAYLQLNDLDRLWIPDDTKPPDPKWDTYFEPREELSMVPPVGEAGDLYFAIPRSRWDGATMSLGEYEARYDGALCQLDTKLRYLFEGLRRRGRLLNTTVVVVGTYGIGFGESGLILDSGSLSDVDLHVPLIIRPAPPLDCPGGRQSTILASLIDLAPTLLDLAGIEKPRGMHGVSLAATVRGPERSVREYAFASGGLQAGYVVLDERWCWEKSTPGVPGPRGIATSWFGDETEGPPRWRTFLHDREAGGPLGHLHGGQDDPATAERLDEQGRLRFELLRSARDVLQGSIEGDTSALRAKLREHGLIGDDVGAPGSSGVTR